MMMRNQSDFLQQQDERERCFREWVDFIERLDSRVGGFRWFATLTFKNETHPESAYKAFERWQHMIGRAVHGVRYTSRPGEGLSTVLAMEYQRRGVLHFHALVAGVDLSERRQAFLMQPGQRYRLAWFAPLSEQIPGAPRPELSSALSFRRLTAMDWWYRMAGIARIYDYQRGLGAERYVSKYIMKGGDIALYGPFAAEGRELPRSGE